MPQLRREGLSHSRVGIHADTPLRGRSPGGSSLPGFVRFGCVRGFVRSRVRVLAGRLLPPGPPSRRWPVAASSARPCAMRDAPAAWCTPG